MSEETPEATQSDMYTSNGSSNIVAIIAIVATMLIVLSCIVACSFVAYTFVVNAPW